MYLVEHILSMGRKYKFKLLEKEIASVNKILADNEVTLSFDGPQTYVKAMQEISPVLHKSYDRYLKFVGDKKLEDVDKIKEDVKESIWIDTCTVKGEEYNVTNDMQLVTSGYGYPFKFHEFCPRDNISKCAEIINYVLRDVGIAGCIFDYNSEYGLAYEGDGSDDIYQGLYIWLNETILDRTTKEQRELFFTSLGLEAVNLDFICDDYNAGFEYIGFNDENRIVKYGVKFSSDEYFLKKPEEYYKDYSRMGDVISCLVKLKTENNITMQYIPGRPESIAIETKVTKENYRKTVKEIISCGLITQAQGAMLLEMPLERWNHTMFKYKWDVKDKFEVKVYYLADLS